MWHGYQGETTHLKIKIEVRLSISGRGRSLIYKVHFLYFYCSKWDCGIYYQFGSSLIHITRIFCEFCSRCLVFLKVIVAQTWNQYCEFDVEVYLCNVWEHLWLTFWQFIIIWLLMLPKVWLSFLIVLLNYWHDAIYLQCYA